MSKRKQVSIGEKYNNLTVIERLENHVTPSGASFSKWRCQCDCERYVDVLGSSLTAGHTKSCGCLSKRHKVNDEDMLEKTFGKLKVVSRAPSHKIPSGSVYDMWNCVCECGTPTVSFGRNLRMGRNESCGCQRVINQAAAKWTPKAETWMIEYLKEHNIEYEYQKTFTTLVGLNGGLLSYDFFIPTHNLLIELNGLQHYKPIDWFGGDKTLTVQQQHDALKQDYANANSYNLAIIDTNRITKIKLIEKIHSIGL